MIMRKLFTLTVMTLLLSIVGADAQNYRKWDFTQWSFTTIDNLKAEDIIGGIDGAGWSSTEKANGDNPQPDNCYWSYSEDNSVNGVLSANGVAIAETEGLIFNPQYTVKRNLAIAVNYPTTTLGTYAGSQYLWLAGGNAKSASARIVCFTIPKVKVGQKITMVVESHKPTDARGVALYVNDATDDANQIGESFKPTTQESHTWVNWTVPAGAATNADGTVDILVVNTSGCHIYSIEVGDDPENTGETPEEICINVTNFPDENFRNYLLEQDYGKDGVLTEEEIEGIISINVRQKEITNLKGIEYFTALKYLYCDKNQLTVLDVSKNTELTNLSCSNNQLTALDVSKNTELTTLYCFNNQLTTLDVSRNTALTKLSCENNQLSALDVSNNTALTSLPCDNNQLTALDVSKNPALISLACSNNQLTALDVSKNPALSWLECYRNNIKGETMTALINSLPNNNNSEINYFCAIYIPTKETNILTKSQVAAVKAKGWIPQYYDSGWKEYEGSDDEVGEDPTIEQCEKPTILYANGELTFGCATEGVEFHWTITNGADSIGNGSKVSFTPKTTVSVYASKDGFKDSDTATLDINGSGGLKGDVNNNGGIDIGDAVTIVNYLVGKTATLSRGTGVTEDMKEPQ